METILKIDTIILDFIQNYLRCGFLDSLFVFITKLGDMGLIWILITLVFLATDKYRKAGSAMAIGLFICLILGNEVLKEVFARPRPFQASEFSLIIAPPSGYSFPSGHTMSSFAAATSMGLSHKRLSKWGYILAGLIAFSRMYLYVHYFTDVLAGAILGVIFGYIGSAIVYKKLDFRRRR